MPPRSTYSLIGVLAGFACVFSLLVKREKKMPGSSADALLEQAQAQMREAQAKNRERAVQAITQKNNLEALTIYFKSSGLSFQVLPPTIAA